MTKKTISRSARVLGLAVLVVLGGCFDEDRVDLVTPTQQAEARITLLASDLTARVGDRITVALEATAPATHKLAAVQGTFRFDPNRLRFLGQIPGERMDGVVIINDANVAKGEIRLIGMSPFGLGTRTAQLAFEVRSTSYAGAIGFAIQEVSDLNSEVLRASVAREVALDAQLPSPAKPVHWNHLDWALFLDPSIEKEISDIKSNIIGLPTDGTLYGDSNLSGTITAADYTDVGSTAVGTREVIIGTTAVDRVTAANVRPVAGGGCQVGHSGTDCSTRVISGADATPVGVEALFLSGSGGTDQVVVGDPIPLPKASYTAAFTVTLAAQTIIGNRRFHRDTLYVLAGTLTVGQEAAPNCNAGELQVDPGTRVEGQLNSAIFITRCGRLISDGTPTRPITYTCQGAPSAGCWGGVFVSGNAVINEQDIVTLPQPLGPAPQLGTRNPTAGQNQRRGEGGAVNHGGGNDADSSGVIRYSRFLYGGRDLGNNNELNNLTIGSCGSKTVLDHIQVHAGEDDGLEFFGGRCSLKYLYATANDDDQFDYSFGYDGNVQFLVLQHCRVALADCDRNFEVDNTETASTYNNAPRTNPQIFNVTLVGGTQGTGPGAGNSHVNYRRGAGGTIRNGLIIGGDVAFIIDNTETCNANSGFSWGTTVVMTVDTVLKGSAACTPAAIRMAIDVDTVPTGGSGLKDAFNTQLPDFRPVGNGVAAVTLTPSTPPAGPFFDATANFFGGVRPIGLDAGSISWTQGWTVGWQTATAR